MIIWVITGLWIFLGCTEVAHFITLVTNRSLQTYTALYGVFALAGLFVYVGITFLWLRMKKKEFKPGGSFQASPYMAVFAVLAGITLFHFWQGYVPILEDAVYEMVIGTVNSGSIMTVHPFTGQAGGDSMPFRMQILGLSSLYSALITESQQSQYTIMCKVVPVIVYTLSMLLYWAFAQKLFPTDKDKRWVFLSVVSLFVLATSGSDGLMGQRLLYAGFSGETIRGVLLMPYTVYVCWQKKWLLAILAIFVEACLVWTTFGVGYCLLITVCMFAVHLFMNWRAKHAA